MPDMHSCFLQADSVEVAADIINKHDDLVDNGQPVDRVTHYLVGHGAESLRSDMEQHAAGRGMTQRLRTELLGYQMAMLDDTAVGAVHRDVTYASSRALGARTAYRAASLRLSQHIDLIDGLRVASWHRFLHHLSR